MSRTNIFCLKFGNSAPDALCILRQAYCEEAIDCTQCFEVSGHFKSGRTSLEDYEQSGRADTRVAVGNVKRIHQFSHGVRRRIIYDIIDVVGLSAESAWEHETCLCQVSLRSTDPWAERTSRQNLSRSLSVFRGWSILHVEDGNWVYSFDLVTKQQSTQGKSASSPVLKKAQQPRSSVDSLLVAIFFSNIRNILHWKFITESQTMNQKFFHDILKSLRENLGESERICGARRRGFLTSTVHPVTEVLSLVIFSTKITWYHFRTCSIHQIYHMRSSITSPRGKPKITVLTPLSRLKESREILPPADG